ncbi:hypothetical protein DSECCO2_556460 [anaerobic digester metagenome]
MDVFVANAGTLVRNRFRTIDQGATEFGEVSKLPICSHPRQGFSGYIKHRAILIIDLDLGVGILACSSEECDAAKIVIHQVIYVLFLIDAVYPYAHATLQDATLGEFNGFAANFPFYR